MNGEDVSVRRIRLRVAIGVFEYLDFDASVKWNTSGRNIVRPQKDTRIAFGNQVPPLDFEHEILVHPARTDLTIWSAGTHQHVVLNGPCGWRSICEDPVTEIVAVEQQLKSIVSIVGIQDARNQQQTDQSD